MICEGFSSFLSWDVFDDYLLGFGMLLVPVIFLFGSYVWILESDEVLLLVVRCFQILLELMVVVVIRWFLMFQLVLRITLFGL